MWVLRRPMPVSSVVRSTAISPVDREGWAGSTASCPERLRVFASKLPPTVSGHNTTTSPEVTRQPGACARAAPDGCIARASARPAASAATRCPMKESRIRA